MNITSVDAREAIATVASCAVIESPFGPPIQASETRQALLPEPIWIDAHDCVPVRQSPGVGVPPEEGQLGVLGAWRVP